MPTTVTIPQPIPLDHNTAFDFFRVPKVPQDLGLHFDYGFDTSNSTPDSRFPSAIATFKSVHIEFANLAPQQSPGPNVKILGDLQFGAAIKKQKLLDGSSRSIQDHSLSCEADHTFLSTASKLDSPALSKNSPTESNQKKGSGADYTPLSASMRALPALSSNSLAESSRPKGSEVDHNSASKRALPALASKNPAISNQQKTNVGRAAYQKKSRFLKQLKCKTRLRKDRPVVAEVNLDIWREILAFCPPDFLIKARGVCKTFKSILDEKSQMVWQLSRIRYFGPAIPDPPLGVSEMQYADLITGTGCQNINCKMEKAARKTYWAFQRRLCDDCLHARAVKVSRHCPTRCSRTNNSIVSRSKNYRGGRILRTNI